MAEHPSWFGPERRGDGPAKLAGHARYAADLHAADVLELAFATATDVHAHLVAVDTREALGVPGVRLILTGSDLTGLLAGRMLLDQPLLATDRVRFVGERIAVIAADTARAAEQAARLITASTRPLPPLLDPAAALAADADILHPDAGDYHYLAGTRPPVSHPNLQGEVIIEHHPDALPAAFATAAHVFEHTFTTPREHQGYLEPHATLVQPLPDGRLLVRSANKHPFLLRRQLAESLALPPERFLIDTPNIGGDFGGKGAPFDEPICCLIALRTGRPVRHVMSYEQELRATNPRQAARLHLRTAVDGDGRLTAHEARVIFDGGAYAAGTPVPTMVAGGSWSTLSAYHIPAARIVLQQVYTTTVPTGHMRAPGEVQTQFASERHLDLIAVALDTSPMSLRRRHVARGDQRGTGGEHFRQPLGAQVLTELERHHTQHPLGTPAAGLLRGRGIALGAREMHGGTCGVRLSLRNDGRVEVLTAQPDQGGGVHSALHRIAARALNLSPDEVVVRQGDTDTAPFDMGSAASRVTWVAGGATEQAALLLKQKLEHAAAALLNTDTVELRYRAFHRPGRTPIQLSALVGRLPDLPALSVEVSHDGSPPRTAVRATTASPATSSTSTSTQAPAPWPCSRRPSSPTPAPSSTRSRTPGNCRAASPWASAPP